MLTDERYGRHVGTRLRQEVAGVRAAPNLVAQLRRRQLRRTLAVRAAIATPMVAAVAAAILVTTAGPPSPGGRAPQAGGGVPSTDSGPVRLETVAHVQAQTIKALGRASDYVIYSKTIHDGDPYGVYEEQWLDKATQRSRVDYYGGGPRIRVGGSGGKPVFTLEPDPTPGRVELRLSQSFSGPLGDQVMVQVNYYDRMWHQERYTQDAPSAVDPDITDADAVRKAIADGTLELLGEEKVDGFDTLHLRLYGPEKSSYLDMWVDAKSYLPVKEISDKSPADPDSLTLNTTYRWLPRTEENLARLELTPPPGFKRT